MSHRIIAALLLAALIAAGCSRSSGLTYSGGGDKPLPDTSALSIEQSVIRIEPANNDMDFSAFFTKYISLDFYARFNLPPDAWLKSDSTNPVVTNIEEALVKRNTYWGYWNMPTYYTQRNMTFNVVYIVDEEVPYGLLNPDWNKDDRMLNGPTEFPEMCPRTYYIDQSYGKFAPSFNIVKHIYSSYPYMAEVNIDLFKLLSDESNMIEYPVMRPVIAFGGDERHGGHGDAGIYDYAEGQRGADKSCLGGVIRLALAPNQFKGYVNTRICYARAWADAVHHEIGHLMNWPDTYVSSRAEGVSSVDGVDLMGNSLAPLGIHKVVNGWTCFINVKHDSRGMVLKPQDLGENPREIFFLKNREDISNGAEFYYMENQAGGGLRNLGRYYDEPLGGVSWTRGFATSGLVVPRIYLPLSNFGDGSDWPMVSIPSVLWARTQPEFPAGGRPAIFPYVGSGFGGQSNVPANWHDGENAGVGLSGIAFEGNRHFRMWLDRSGAEECGYGDIICNVDVGSPLVGDLNGDGIVNDGDRNFLLANMGRRVGVDPLAVPLDVNGDGKIGLARDRDRDGFIATSERIYDDAWTLVHTTGDWLDTNGDGRNDLDEDGSGQYDSLERAAGLEVRPPDARPESVWRNDPLGRTYTPPDMGARLRQALIAKGIIPGGSASAVTYALDALTSQRMDGDSINYSGPSGRLPRGPELGGVAALLDADGDGCIDTFDADLDGHADLVPPSLDPNGDGVVNELDAAYLGYYWGESTFEELWIPLPAPNWD